MKEKVIKSFIDKHTKKGYNVGRIFESDDQARIDELQKAGYLMGTSPSADPDNSVVGQDDNQSMTKEELDPDDYQAMTKEELGELLESRGIEFNKKLTKTELIDLLMGGDG